MLVLMSKYNDPVAKLIDAVGTAFVIEAVPKSDPVIP